MTKWCSIITSCWIKVNLRMILVIIQLWMTVAVTSQHHFTPPSLSQVLVAKNSPVYRKIISSHLCLFKPPNVATVRYIHRKHIVSLCLSTVCFFLRKLWLLCEKGSDITWKKRSFLNPLQTSAINCTIPNPRQLLLLVHRTLYNSVESLAARGTTSIPRIPARRLSDAYLQLRTLWLPSAAE